SPSTRYFGRSSSAIFEGDGREKQQHALKNRIASANLNAIFSPPCGVTLRWNRRRACRFSTEIYDLLCAIRVAIVVVLKSCVMEPQTHSRRSASGFAYASLVCSYQYGSRVCCTLYPVSHSTTRASRDGL